MAEKRLLITRNEDIKDWKYKHTTDGEEKLELGFPHDREGSRRAGAWAIELANKYEATHVKLDLSEKYAREVAEGVEHGSYKYDRFTKQEFTVEEIEFLSGKQEDIDLGMAMGEATNYARDLINTPANIMNSEQLATEAESLEGVEVTIRDEKWLKKKGMRLVLSVNQASKNPAKFIELSYGTGKQHIALCGKGVTFDTGGLSIKPSKGMQWMKADMGGAAAVLAVFKFAAEMQLPVTLKGYIPCVENAISGDATRVSDVIESYDGTSVEIMNTDAEGRLILADAIAYAAEQKPRIIIDLATLTGSALVSLGHEYTAVMGDEQTCKELINAGETAGDFSWQLPLNEEFLKQFESKVADTTNVGKQNLGGASQGGAFLKQFVPDGQKWVHMDIAGTAFRENAPLVKPTWQRFGANGGAVRLLLEWLRTN